LGTEADELLLHLAREAADGGVVEPVGDGLGFGFLEALDGLLLLLEVARVFDFGFDGLEFDPDGAGELRFTVRGWVRNRVKVNTPLKPTEGLNGPPDNSFWVKNSGASWRQMG